jgi:hypothetical protein
MTQGDRPRLSSLGDQLRSCKLTFRNHRGPGARFSRTRNANPRPQNFQAIQTVTFDPPSGPNQKFRGMRTYRISHPQPQPQTTDYFIPSHPIPSPRPPHHWHAQPDRPSHRKPCEFCSQLLVRLAHLGPCSRRRSQARPLWAAPAWCAFVLRIRCAVRRQGWGEAAVRRC